MSEKSWYVYMILSDRGSLYTGISTDVERRFQEHQTQKKGAKFFRSCAPRELVYVEKTSSRSQASIAEARIKKLNKKEKESLIQDYKTGKIK